MSNENNPERIFDALVVRGVQVRNRDISGRLQMTGQLKMPVSPSEFQKYAEYFYFFYSLLLGGMPPTVQA